MKKTMPESNAGAADEKKKRIGYEYIILAVIIVLQLGYTIFCFEVKKTGSFGDEAWSYGLSNGYYQPLIYVRPGVDIDHVLPEDIVNYNEWVSGDVFKEYITVQPDERFSYGSVVSNQTYDHHPPLYYLILHTICSFFPNSFSYRYAFAFSCVCLVINTFFLYKLAKLLLGSESKGLFVCAFYAVGTGALSTFIFLRQYFLLTTLTVCCTYFTARLFFSERALAPEEKGDMKPFRSSLPFIALTAPGMFFTHYYAVAYVGLLTAGMCIWFLCKKRIKKMFVYGGSLLASLGVFLALYPAVLTHISNSSDDSEMNNMGYLFNLRMLTGMVLKYSVGLRVSLWETNRGTYALTAAVFLLALLLPLGFLFRNEAWFKKLLQKLKAAGLAAIGAVRGIDMFSVMLTATVTGCVLLIAKVSDVFESAEVVTRYVFFVMPAVCLLFVRLFDAAISAIPTVKRYFIPVMTVICLLLTVRMHIRWDCPFYMESCGTPEQVAEELEGKNCLVLINGVHNLLESYTSYIYKTNLAYPVLTKELADNKQTITDSGVEIDCILVSSDWYQLSDEQEDYLRKRLADFGEPVDTTLIGLDDDGSADAGDPLGIMSAEETNKIENTKKFYSDTLNEVCDTSSYVPEYVININGGYHYVLKKNGSWGLPRR